jgi:tetratricopeptide (TPR) repeat protein
VPASIYNNVREGNKLYEEERYDEAVEEYSKAGDGESDADILSFNTGAALYRQGKYEEATDAFTNALITEDKGLEAMANYNIANSKYRLGSLKAEEDMSEAVNLYRESLDHYKRAIELDEDNDDARYNHELVEKRLKVLLERMKSRQEEKKGEEEKEGEDRKEAEEQQAGNTDKENGAEEQEPESAQAGTGNQEEETGKESASQQDEAGSDESAGTGEEDRERMTPEEANMLLEAFGEEESLDRLQRRGRAQYRGVIKDW